MDARCRHERSTIGSIPCACSSEHRARPTKKQPGDRASVRRTSAQLVPSPGVARRLDRMPAIHRRTPGPDSPRKVVENQIAAISPDNQHSVVCACTGLAKSYHQRTARKARRYELPLFCQCKILAIPLSNPSSPAISVIRVIDEVHRPVHGCIDASYGREQGTS